MEKEIKMALGLIFVTGLIVSPKLFLLLIGYMIYGLLF
jgi:hypothetical protein|tara:strand:- start:1321 stop:1434 length:114 start_codon:yes stop_codon:yes gene_type:complete